MSRMGTSVRTHLRGFIREPLNAVLILVLPILAIEIYGTAISTFPTFAFGDISMDPAMLGNLSGAMFAMAALAGIIGLFQVINANEADRRLVLAGFPVGGLLLSRFLTVLVVDIAAAIVSTVTLMTKATIEAPLLAFGALAIVGVFYSSLGVLLGNLLSRELEGSLAIVFLVDMDVVLSSGFVPIKTDATKLSPLHYPQNLFSTAVTDGTIASDSVVPALLYAGALIALATITYVKTNSIGGDSA